ncbi:MAG: Hsp20/alpha crystallin family protein [Candidatus Paceibacterota bacterium]
MLRKNNKKRSFFEKLTGVVPADDFDDFDFEEREAPTRQAPRRFYEESIDEEENSFDSEIDHPQPTQDGQLAVDVLNTDDAIIVRAMLAGVKPSDIDIDIARDLVTIRGTRQEEHEVSEDNYYHKELFWGSFSRNILLPEEIDVDQAEAIEKNGLLVLKLPKLDKKRKAKLIVKGK